MKLSIIADLVLLLAASASAVRLSKRQAPTSPHYNPIWGGAVQGPDSSITRVTGTFTVPVVKNGAPEDPRFPATWIAYFWVGIDGSDNESESCHCTLFQTGVGANYVNGSTSYYAWYEWVPGYISFFSPSLAIAPGNVITLTVTTTSSTGGVANVTNKSTGKSVSKTLTNQPALCMQTAEWIVEAPSGQISNFNSVTFSNASYLAGGVTKGTTGATIYDIAVYGNNQYTDCSIPSSSSVTCNYEKVPYAGPAYPKHSPCGSPS